MFMVRVCDRHVSTANEVCLCNPLITATTHNSAIIVFLFGTDWLAGIKTKRTITQIQQKNTLFLLGPGADDNWPRSRDCYANNIITRRERCPVPGSMFMNCLTYEAIICCCVPSEHTHPRKKNNRANARGWMGCTVNRTCCPVSGCGTPSTMSSSASARARVTFCDTRVLSAVLSDLIDTATHVADKMGPVAWVETCETNTLRRVIDGRENVRYGRNRGKVSWSFKAHTIYRI